MIEIENLKNNIKLGKISQVFSKLDDKSFMNIDEAKEIFLFLYDYTNSFKNSNTTPQILNLAGRMLQFGINHDKLIVAKTKRTFSQMKICKDIIKKVELYNSGAICGAIVDLDLINKYGMGLCIGDSFISDLLVTISGTELCFLIVENIAGGNDVILNSKYEKNNIAIIQEKLGINSENRVSPLSSSSILEIILES
ncbi:MAG: hypothetical protein PHZ26_02055 [Candidatus Gracilibacteria bacterium]|nr:hypothetical protein [Candidatus Gracilibacteria bacterium]MDD2908518.1 hypothetical protein [Candidatus Gracilibacteria bacterium]